MAKTKKREIKIIIFKFIIPKIVQKQTTVIHKNSNIIKKNEIKEHIREIKKANK